MSETRKITLDVRATLAAGQEPFPQIINAVDQLTDSGDQLLLIAPFEPVPLFRVLERQGFDHETAQRADGTYEIRFTRR